MLGGVITFISDNLLIVINLLVLVVVLSLTFTAKNKDIGVLVSCYYAFYICLDLYFFKFLENHTLLTFDKFAVFYLMCFVLTFIVFILAIYLFEFGNNVAGLYAFPLLICLCIDGIACIFQLLETNYLLIVYNVIQNVSIYVDLFVVFIGMDHIIKRKHNGSQILIDYVNNYLDDCRFIPILHISKGAKCKQKN